MFTGDELYDYADYWSKQGVNRANEVMIMAYCVDDEPELMAYWVYRKRIRVAPEDVQVAAANRMADLCDMTGLRFGDVHKHVFENVCNAIWDRLPEDERQRLMRSI